MTIRLSPTDAYALARRLVNESTEGLDVSPSTAMILKTFDSPLYTDGLKNMLEKTGVMDQIFAVDPCGPPPEAKPEKKQDVYIPPLPDYAQLSDQALREAESVGRWYRDAVAWTKKRSPKTPPHFLEAGVIWVIGLAIARRVCIELNDKYFPHLYLLMVAETSRYAKSTGLRGLLSLILGAMPHMLMPGQLSPEGMIEVLSGSQPSNYDKLGKFDKALVDNGRAFSAQRGIVLDEYSGMLAASKKDYMAGFVELIMRLYDAGELEQHYSKTGGLVIIKNPGISIMGATTPAAMARNVKIDMWEDGDLARYLIMFRDYPRGFDPNYIPTAPPQHLLTSLKRLHEALPKMRDDLGGESDDFALHYAMMSESAHDAYQAYARAMTEDMIDDNIDLRFHGNYSRMHVQALKIALALACMDWSENGANNKVRIELGHWAMGQMIAEKGRDSLHRLMPILTESSDSRAQRDLLALLKHEPQLTLRDISRRLGRKTNDLRSAIDVLIESGEIIAIKTLGKNNREIFLYEVTPV